MKCTYCDCTADLEPGKDYCLNCGHDASAHVASGAPAKSGQGWLILGGIILVIILIVYFSNRENREGSYNQPIPQRMEPPPSPPPPVANEPSHVPSAPPPGSEQSEPRYTPPEPKLGPWEPGR
jgi:hypothetical protein